MQYTRLGHTGLEVSRICLGCMSFGEPKQGSHEWTLDEAASRPILRAAWEAGINFYDTANVYSLGSSEEIVGKVLLEMAPRDELVIATKVNGEMREGPNGKGLSRKAILAEIDNSLRRLGTDYIDLYQIHRFDPATPIEETLEVLNDVVRAGKARYIGASSMAAWQFLKMLMTSDKHGWARFVSMQNQLNLIEREEERVEAVVPDAALEQHEAAAEQFVWATAATLLLAALVLVAPGGAARLLTATTVLATMVVAAAAIRVGHAGGRLVYQHNAGAAYAAPAQAQIAGEAPTPLQSRRRAGDDDDDRDRR